MEQKNSKRKYHVSFLIMLFCFFCFTVEQFIPIYFKDTSFRASFYFAILILFIITVSRTIFKRVRKSLKDDIYSAWFYSIFLGFGTLVLFGFWTFCLLLSVWTEASTLFLSKDNPNVKIISRYVNEGAFGGGTEPNDYQIVLQRPVLFYFKMETSIDTTKINRANWIRPHE